MSLADIFGGSPVSKVLDFFRINCEWDYSLHDISKETGASYRTLQMIVPKLIELGILKYNRTEGKAKLYIFNSENKLAKQLQTIAVENDIQKIKKDSEESENQIKHKYSYKIQKFSHCGSEPQTCVSIEA